MNGTFKYSDLKYREAPELGGACLSEMNAVKGVMKDQEKLWREWENKHFREIQTRRDVCLENCSNFHFLTTHLDREHGDVVRGVLKSYEYKPGFSMEPGHGGLVGYKCVYDKAVTYEDDTQNMVSR